MKTGYVKAVAALLVASGWVVAQAPLPISYNETSPGPVPMAGNQSPAKSQPQESRDNAVRVEGATESAPSVTGYAPPCTKVLPAGGYADCWGAHSCCLYANAEFIMWRINNGSVPQINVQPPVGTLTVQTFDYINTVGAGGTVTTTTQAGVIGYFPLRIENVPGLPNAGSVNLGESLGGRFNLGCWFTSDHCFGLEGDFFFLERRSQDLANAVSNSNDQILYTTPFVDREFNVTPAQGDSPPTRTQTGTFPIFFVRQLDSSVVATLSNSMYGAEVNARSTCCYFGPVAIGGLLGFRYLQFTEDLSVQGDFNLFAPPGVPPATGANGNPRPSNLPDSILVQTRDTVSGRNFFYGGNIGADFDGQFGGFFINLRTKVAMGGMHQRVDINSFTTTTASATTLVPASTNTTAGGLLFNQLNNGAFKRERISFIPELNLKAGYNLTSWLRGYVGYDIMYISNVVRPGQVSAPLAVSGTFQDSSAPVSPSQANPANTGTTNLTVTQPSFRWADGNLWTQGINFGIEISF